MRSIDVNRYRYNYEDFNEKFIYQIFLNWERTITTQGAHTTLVLSFLLFLSW